MPISIFVTEPFSGEVCLAKNYIVWSAQNRFQIRNRPRYFEQISTSFWIFGGFSLGKIRNRNGHKRPNFTDFLFSWSEYTRWEEVYHTWLLVNCNCHRFVKKYFFLSDYTLNLKCHCVFLFNCDLEYVHCTMYDVHCTYSNKILVFYGKMAWHITLKRRKSVKLGHFCCKLYSGKNSNGLLFQDISNRFFIWNKLGKPHFFFFFFLWTFY